MNIPVIMTCLYCEGKYKLGFDGTVDGCDACLDIERNPVNGSIIIQPEKIDLLKVNAVDWAEETYRQDRAIAQRTK